MKITTISRARDPVTMDISASTDLMKLIDEGRAGLLEVKCYMGSTAQIGDLTRISSIPSVMLNE